MVESRISAGGALEKLPGWENLTQRRLRGPAIWNDMLKNALRDVAKWRTKKREQLYKVSSPCVDDHQFKQEELESVGESSKVCSQFVLKCLYLARIVRLDILWPVHKVARSVTKWTGACDCSARLISYTHHTNDHRQYFHV